MFGAVRTVSILLVDGENLSQSLAGQIITKAMGFGRPIVQRVYGDVARLPAWEAADGFEMIHTGHAKNGADMRMVIDALDLVHRGGVGRVILASSDRDFTHFAQHLRAKGIEVLGIGEAKTHESFRKACSSFVELLPRPIPKMTVAPQAEPCLDDRLGKAPPDQVTAQIVAFIAAMGKDGMMIQDLSVKMAQAFKFKVTSTGHTTWRHFLATKRDWFILEPKGPQMRVRLK